MADWYVFQHDGDPLGPWSTDAVANQILAGKLAPDIWVAAPGGQRWLRALDVPVIAGLVEGIPTKPRRRDSGLRIIPGAFATENGRPAFGSTMMMVRDEEIDSSMFTRGAPAPGPGSSAQTYREAAPAADTAKVYGFAPSSEAPPTERTLPPSSSTPEPPTPLAPPKKREATPLPSSDRRRRTRSG